MCCGWIPCHACALLRRYARHFSVVSITDFDDATLRRIFSSLLSWALDKAPFPTNIKVRALVG